MFNHPAELELKHWQFHPPPPPLPLFMERFSAFLAALCTRIHVDSILSLSKSTNVGYENVGGYVFSRRLPLVPLDGA